MKKQIMVFTIILFLILFSFFFWLTSYSSEDTVMLSKTEKEIEYLEEKIIEMMNSLNQITLSNSILVEEKTEKSNGDTKESQNEQQSNTNGESQGNDQASRSSNSNSSTSSSESGNNKENKTEESKKYEIMNDSILANNNQTIDWEYIKSNIESIHSTWATLTIDLHSLNVNNEDILNFSNVLDKVTISAKQEDKTATLNNLASLYGFFPVYVNQISTDSEKINIDYTKTSVLNSYAFLEQNKWEEMKVQVTNAINYFTNILNIVNEDRESQTNISKIYVLLNELNNSIDLKDKDLYLIKYKNVMEELMNFKYTNER